MEVAQLRCFLAVAEELHFGRAAERLHIAQPAISRTIQQLERELKTTLFERSTRSVRLTAGGQALVGPATTALDAVRRAELSVRSVDGGHVGEVRVAYAGVSSYALVAALARLVRSRHPGIALELSSQNFAQQGMKKLINGETDIALGRWDVVPAKVGAKIVMSDSLVVALSDRHQLAGAPRISISQLADDDFVSLPPYEGSVLPDRLRRLALADGFVPHVVQIAPDSQSALALVAAEVGCHLTLASVEQAVSDPHVRFVPVDTSSLDAREDVHLRAAWRGSDADPAVRAVLEELFGIARHDDEVAPPVKAPRPRRT